MPYAILNSLIVPISEENTMPNLNNLLLLIFWLEKQTDIRILLIRV